jgi:hypothetical protein
MTTGDVITSKVKYLPFIYHYGIYLNDNNQGYVMHHSWKGSIIEPLNQFLIPRELVSVYPSSLNELSNTELITQYNKCKGRFDLVSYNCEHFVSRMQGLYPVSHQVTFWVVLIVFFVLMLVLLYKSK